MFFYILQHEMFSRFIDYSRMYLNVGFPDVYRRVRPTDDPVDMRTFTFSGHRIPSN